MNWISGVSISVAPHSAHCHRRRLVLDGGGIELAGAVLLREVHRDRERLEQHEAVVVDRGDAAVGIDGEVTRASCCPRRSRPGCSRRGCRALQRPTARERCGSAERRRCVASSLNRPRGLVGLTSALHGKSNGPRPARRYHPIVPDYPRNERDHGPAHEEDTHARRRARRDGRVRSERRRRRAGAS